MTRRNGSRTPFITLMIVGAAANVGTRVSAIAIPWFVLTTTNSPTVTGLVAACELGPYVVAKALGGPIVDRIGQRRVSIVADIGSALVIGTIPALHAADLLALPVLLTLVAIAGALRGPGDNAKHTAVPLVAEIGQVPLERATGLFGAIERGSGLVAPGVAAGMIALFGPPGAITVTAACFGVTAVLILIFLPRTFDDTPFDDATPGDAATAGGYLSQLRDGFTFLIHDRLLLMLVLMILVTNLLDVAKTSVLLPVWAKSGGHGVESISLLLTCVAGASMISSLVASWLGPRLPRKLTFFAAFLIAGPAPYLTLGLDWPVWRLAIVYTVAGLASGFVNPMLGAIFYERIPRHLLGRVSGLSDATAWAGMPFGGLVGAGLIALIGLSPTFLVLAGVYVLATVIPGLLSRDLFDRPLQPVARSRQSP